MEELASILMHSRTQAHVFHLGVNGPGAFSAHMALGTYYDEIVDLVDGLVESYQGKYGLIQFKPVINLDNNCDVSNIVKYFDKLIQIVCALRQAPNLADSFIQNEIDNVMNLLYSTKYKLVNLQ
jgi:DNA-binding ferritin-like protein